MTVIGRQSHESNSLTTRTFSRRLALLFFHVPTPVKLVSVSRGRPSSLRRDRLSIVHFEPCNCKCKTAVWNIGAARHCAALCCRIPSLVDPRDGSVLGFASLL